MNIKHFLRLKIANAEIANVASEASGKQFDECLACLKSPASYPGAYYQAYIK